jgi:hypothetical protein
VPVTTYKGGDIRNAYTILVGKDEGKKLFGTARNRCEVILKWILKEYILGALTGFRWIRIYSNNGIF